MKGREMRDTGMKKAGKAGETHHAIGQNRIEPRYDAVNAVILNFMGKTIYIHTP